MSAMFTIALVLGAIFTIPLVFLRGYVSIAEINHWGYILLNFKWRYSTSREDRRKDGEFLWTSQLVMMLAGQAQRPKTQSLWPFKCRATTNMWCRSHIRSRYTLYISWHERKVWRVKLLKGLSSKCFISYHEEHRDKSLAIMSGNIMHDTVQYFLHSLTFYWFFTSLTMFPPPMTKRSYRPFTWQMLHKRQFAAL